jgi:hypothetical protein
MAGCVIATASAFLYIRARGVAMPFSALFLAWSLLAVVSVIQLIIGFRFPQRSHGSRHPQREAAVYRRPGILILRSGIRRGPLHLLAPMFQITGRAVPLESLKREMERAEDIHLVALAASLVPIVFSVSVGKVAGSACWRE